eukprot:gene23669-29912_t
MSFVIQSSGDDCDTLGVTYYRDSACKSPLLFAKMPHFNECVGYPFAGKGTTFESMRGGCKARDDLTFEVNTLVTSTFAPDDVSCANHPVSFSAYPIKKTDGQSPSVEASLFDSSFTRHVKDFILSSTFEQSPDSDRADVKLNQCMKEDNIPPNSVGLLDIAQRMASIFSEYLAHTIESTASVLVNDMQSSPSDHEKTASGGHEGSEEEEDDPHDTTFTLTDQEAFAARWMESMNFSSAELDARRRDDDPMFFGADEVDDNPSDDLSFLYDTFEEVSAVEETEVSPPVAALPVLESQRLRRRAPDSVPLETQVSRILTAVSTMGRRLAEMTVLPAVSDGLNKWTKFVEAVHSYHRTGAALNRSAEGVIFSTFNRLDAVEDRHESEYREDDGNGEYKYYSQPDDDIAERLIRLDTHKEDPRDTVRQEQKRQSSVRFYGAPEQHVKTTIVRAGQRVCFN